MTGAIVTNASAASRHEVWKHMKIPPTSLAVDEMTVGIIELNGCTKAFTSPERPVISYTSNWSAQG